MNKIDEMAFLGKTKDEAIGIFRARKVDVCSIEWVEHGQTITLQARHNPVVFLNNEGLVEEIW